MRIHSGATITVSILSACLSCGGENLSENCLEEESQVIETHFKEELSEQPCIIQNIDDDEKEVNLIIRNQSDYEKYVLCNIQTPNIDFNKYFILAGRYRHHQGALLDSQVVSRCNNKLFYNIWMLEEDGLAFTNVFYIAVIDNAYNDTPVQFNVKFKH